ncbi:MAG: hypothetical protein AAF959_20465 [Cyanobacteria bacterium P01_D01_bin.56]
MRYTTRKILRDYMPLSGDLDKEIQYLIRQGCSQNEVFQRLQTRYPEIVHQAAEVLKRIQTIERGGGR